MPSSSAVLPLSLVPPPHGVGCDVALLLAVSGGVLQCLPPPVVVCVALLLEFAVAPCVAGGGCVLVGVC